MENYRPPYPDAPERPTLKIYPWENMSAHDADVKHLCGQACIQTMVARWMNTTMNTAQAPLRTSIGKSI